MPFQFARWASAPCLGDQRDGPRRLWKVLLRNGWQNFLLFDDLSLNLRSCWESVSCFLLPSRLGLFRKQLDPRNTCPSGEDRVLMGRKGGRNAPFLYGELMLSGSLSAQMPDAWTEAGNIAWEQRPGRPNSPWSFRENAHCIHGTTSASLLDVVLGVVSPGDMFSAFLGKG